MNVAKIPKVANRMLTLMLGGESQGFESNVRRTYKTEQVPDKKIRRDRDTGMQGRIDV